MSTEQTTAERLVRTWYDGTLEFVSSEARQQLAARIAAALAAERARAFAEAAAEVNRLQPQDAAQVALCIVLAERIRALT